MAKEMIRLTSGQYLAVIGEKKMIEVHANSIEKAKKMIVDYGFANDGEFVVCQIQSVIGYIGE